MEVHVMGPNLFTEPTDGSSFHVHAAGCRDVQVRRLYSGPEHRHDRERTYDFASLREVIEDLVFPDIIAENPGSTWENYENEIRVFPCADALPRDHEEVPA